MAVPMEVEDEDLQRRSTSDLLTKGWQRTIVVLLRWVGAIESATFTLLQQTKACSAGYKKKKKGDYIIYESIKVTEDECVPVCLD